MPVVIECWDSPTGHLTRGTLPRNRRDVIIGFFVTIVARISPIASITAFTARGKRFTRNPIIIFIEIVSLFRIFIEVFLGFFLRIEDVIRQSFFVIIPCLTGFISAFFRLILVGVGEFVVRLQF